jgi:tellurite resistance protein
VTILSNADLAQRAGVDPWALHAKIAVGDPAQVESLASAFYKAGGNMAQAHTDQQRSADYRSQGYTAAGTSPIDVDAEAKSTVAAPENLQQIGKILDSVATDLSGAMKTANSEVTTLEGELSSIEGRWTSFMQSIGHHLPPEDQESERSGLIDEAVGKVKSHGSTIDSAVKKYEETIFGAQKSMSDLGYVPPATLDDLYGDGAEYIKQLQQQARQLADKLKNNHTIDGNWATLAHQVAGDAAPYMNDPYFASAFYGELGPQLTQMLPSMMYESGSHTTAADIKTFSHMFGTAVSNQDDDPHMADVANSFMNTPQVASIAWDRGAMVSNGDFPPDWLAKAARYNVLDDFAKNGADGFGGMGYQGTPNGPMAYDMGLPQNTVALWTKDLGQSPAAAREALATMGNGNPDDVTIPADPSHAYETNIHKLVEYGKQEDYPGDVADAYGQAFAAAAGANDEHDGAHSAAAAGFAQALFDDMRNDAGDVQPIAADDMAKIGGSYVQEMAAGAAADNDLDGPLPGQHPAFELSGEDTRDFMKTFVGDAAATGTFDNAAGAAYHDAMLAAARLDGGLPAADAHNMNHVAHAYGSVAGTENSVTREVVGERDESEEHQNELVRNVLSAGVDLIPGEKVAEALAVKIPGTMWDIAKHTTNMGLEQAYGATADPRFDATTDASHAIAVTNTYEQLSMLREAGYPGTEHIPSDLIDPHSGQLLPASQVLQDANLRNSLHEYLGTVAHQHGPDVNSVYDKVNDTSGNYQGGFDTANE